MQVGYRGVDGSRRLDCPAFTRALRHRHRDLLSDASIRELRAALAADVRRLQGAGVDLAGYTLEEVVADAEAACQALDLDQVDLLSVSYGTRVAQTYARLHPQRVRRSAMLGVNPPGGFVWEPDTVEAGLQRYADAYVRSVGTGLPADLVAIVREVNAAMPARWWGIPIDPGKVRLMAFVLLFQVATAAMVFDAYLAAARGDPAGLAVLSVAADRLLPGMMVWGDLFAKGANADLDRARDYRADLDRPELALGSPLSLLIWGSLQGIWPATPPPDGQPGRISEVETLLVSGNLDVSTPADRTASELLPLLPRGRHVCCKTPATSAICGGSSQPPSAASCWASTPAASRTSRSAGGCRCRPTLRCGCRCSPGCWSARGQPPSPGRR